MTDLSLRILHAVRGDNAAIQSLAGAIASRDGEAVRALLSGRGLALDSAEIDSLLSQAASGASGAAFTFTFT